MKEERSPHTRKPLHGRRLRVAEEGSFGSTEESTATGVWRAKRRDSCMGISANQHSPAREACLLTCWSKRGLGAEARASVGSQGEDWGWRHEHSLKGLVCQSWRGGSPGKGLDLPKRQETFFCLFVSWCARRGDLEHRLNVLQRWA